MCAKYPLWAASDHAPVHAPPAEQAHPGLRLRSLAAPHGDRFAAEAFMRQANGELLRVWEMTWSDYPAPSALCKEIAPRSCAS